MPHVDLNLGERSYRISIEPGALNALGMIVQAAAPANRCMVFVDANVAEHHGRAAISSLKEAGFEPARHVLHAVEAAKSLEVAAEGYRAMLAAGLDRKCPVVAVGGGIVGDLAGFVAATYMRGVPFIQVPTTLLAMVDASVGGKTGVNFPLQPTEPDLAPPLGKNLIGAFWQPRAVIIDPNTLTTLEDRHLRCGLAECVKHGVIRDPELFAWIDAKADAILGLDAGVLTELITRSVAIKARVVEADEREAGERALLNLGHTFAHAIEPVKELDLHHGEAVAIGMAAAAHCAARMGDMADGERLRLVKLLERLGLPTRLPKPVDVRPLMEVMMHDKKTEGGRLRLVLPEAIGRARIEEGVAEVDVLAAWAAVGAADGAAGG